MFASCRSPTTATLRTPPSTTTTITIIQTDMQQNKHTHTTHIQRTYNAHTTKHKAWEELRRLQRLRFDYRDKLPPYSYATSLAMGLHHYPDEDLLLGIHQVPTVRSAVAAAHRGEGGGACRDVYALCARFRGAFRGRLRGAPVQGRVGMRFIFCRVLASSGPVGSASLLLSAPPHNTLHTNCTHTHTCAGVRTRVHPRAARAPHAAARARLLGVKGVRGRGGRRRQRRRGGRARGRARGGGGGGGGALRRRRARGVRRGRGGGRVRRRGGRRRGRVRGGRGRRCGCRDGSSSRQGNQQRQRRQRRQRQSVGCRADLRHAVPLRAAAGGLARALVGRVRGAGWLAGWLAWGRGREAQGRQRRRSPTSPALAPVAPPLTHQPPHPYP